MATEMKTQLEEQETKILRRMPMEIIAVSGLMAIVIAILFGPVCGLLGLTGGATSCLWFIWLRKSLFRFLSSGRPQPLRFVLGSQLLRLGLIGLIFLIIIYFFSRQALAFIAGFTVTIIVMAGETIFTLSRVKPWKV